MTILMLIDYNLVIKTFQLRNQKKLEEIEAAELNHMIHACGTLIRHLKFAKDILVQKFVGKIPDKDLPYYNRQIRAEIGLIITTINILSKEARKALKDELRLE